MKTTKKNRLSSTILMSFSALCMVPNTGTCNPPVTTAIFNPSFLLSYDSIISALSDRTKSGDVGGILHELENAAEILEDSTDPVADSCAFLQNLINRMNSEFGTSVTLTEVLRLKNKK